MIETYTAIGIGIWIFVLTYLWTEAKTRKKVLRDQYKFLEQTQNMCDTILRDQGGEDWENFKKGLDETVKGLWDKTYPACMESQFFHWATYRLIQDELMIIHHLMDGVEKKIYQNIFFDDEGNLKSSEQ